MHKYKLNLKQFKRCDGKTLSCKNKGATHRKTLNLEDKERAYDKVVVEIPRDFIKLERPYFSGLFAPTIRKKGKDYFKRKYKFEGNPKVLSLINKHIEAVSKRRLI